MRAWLRLVWRFVSGLKVYARAKAKRTEQVADETYHEWLKRMAGQEPETLTMEQFREVVAVATATEPPMLCAICTVEKVEGEKGWHMGIGDVPLFEVFYCPACSAMEHGPGGLWEEQYDKA